LADPWSSSYLANSPSPVEAAPGGVLYPPYVSAPAAAAAISAAAEAGAEFGSPGSPNGGIALRLEPCAALAAAAGGVAARIAAASSLASASPGAASEHHWALQQHAQPGSTSRLPAAAADAGSHAAGLGLAGSGMRLASAGSHSSTSGGLSAACVGGASGAAAAAGAAGGVLDPGLRLRVRSLRGPLEDAMRCYAEVRGPGWGEQLLQWLQGIHQSPAAAAAAGAVTCLSLVPDAG
jgi:hypothetical protein